MAIVSVFRNNQQQQHVSATRYTSKYTRKNYYKVVPRISWKWLFFENIIFSKLKYARGSRINPQFHGPPLSRFSSTQHIVSTSVLSKKACVRVQHPNRYDMGRTYCSIIIVWLTQRNAKQAFVAVFVFCHYVLRSTLFLQKKCIGFRSPFDHACCISNFDCCSWQQ